MEGIFVILVVNLNVSLDKHYELDAFVPHTVMRVAGVDNTPGGKGLHVAGVLKELGAEVLVTGMIGGRTGEFIERKLREKEILFDFQPISGETRSCLAFTDKTGGQTEVLEPGPVVSEAEYLAFIERYKQLLPAAEIIVCSGSVPQNVPDTVYASLIDIARGYGKKVLLDTSGRLLIEGVKQKPAFIKPNFEELQAFCGTAIDSARDAALQIKSLLATGIGIVAVSLGAQGALVGCDEQIFEIQVPKIKAENAVGSGDAFVGGIAFGLAKNWSLPDTLRLAGACGTANALEKESGFVRAEVVESLLEQVKVRQLTA